MSEEIRIKANNGKIRCDKHGITMREGIECPFCKYEKNNEKFICTKCRMAKVREEFYWSTLGYKSSKCKKCIKDENINKHNGTP